MDVAKVFTTNTVQVRMTGRGDFVSFSSPVWSVLVRKQLFHVLGEIERHVDCPGY